MTYIADESGIETSAPREGIEIILPAKTYRIATGTRNLVIGGETYTAAPAQRTELTVPVIGGDGSPELVLYPAHPFVARYASGGVPPRSILVNVHRVQSSGASEVVWRGRITSLSWRGNEAVFAVPSRRLLLIDRRLPSFSVAKHCPHTLYNANCKVARAGFKVATTIAIVNGRTITVASMGAHGNGWAQFGELVHTATGEPMTIADQIGNVLTVPAPIGSMNTGDAVEVYAGCDHSVATCRDKFSNRVNFGNFPQLNDENITVPPGFGVYVSA